MSFANFQPILRGIASSISLICIGSMACIEFTSGDPASNRLTIRAVFVGLPLFKIFLLSGDTNYRIRGNGKIAVPRWADQLTQ